MQVSQEVWGKIDSLYNDVVCLKFSFSDASVVFLYYFLILVGSVICYIKLVRANIIMSVC